MAATMRIDVYSDLVCPWCYLGKRRFDLAAATRPQYEPRVRWRPFELHPEISSAGRERAARSGDSALAARTEQELCRLGTSIDINFRFDLIGRIPNTRKAHLLIAHADRRGRQAAVLERLMRGYFEEGCDLADIDQLVRLGADAGLAPGEARNALVLRAGEDGIIAAERHAATLGIRAVPTFVFDGRYTISGAQDVGVLAEVFDQVAQFARP